ncbi:septum formation initiator family protein [Paludibacteraceae bacterium OttesenSCG-928-F17]|nr:septum formation initiator family protein [Paludibacteraceae bacterium OttesenSCG-928-F17]
MSFFSTIWTKIKPVILNKYLLALIVFVVFVTFFDNHNLIKRWRTNASINQLEKEIKHYTNEIEQNRQKMEELRSSDENLEKFAREQYLMKKENEDIFLIEE